MADNIEPTTHLEKVIAGQESPITHLEQVIAQYGGGSGVSDYNALENKPSINGVELSGNKTLADIGVDITTTIGPMSTHTQVPSAKTMYDTLKINLIGSKQLSAYGKEIVKYPLGRWGTMGMGVKNLTDLPNDDVKYVEILGISDSATPWTVGLSTRTYRATTEDGAIFTRSITSGEQGGVIEKDTGWQKVSYTKIPDVPVTTISTLDTQNFYSTANKSASKYAVVNGECEVTLFVKADTPATGLITVLTGLPKAKMPVYSTLNGWDKTNDYVIVQINALGNLSLVKGTAGGQYVGSIKYKVVEE